MSLLLTSLLVSLAPLPTQAKAPTTIAYKHVAGEVATYEIRAEIPVNDGQTKGDLRGSVAVRTVSVAEDGTAQLEYHESGVRVKAMGQIIDAPPADPFTVQVDRQGYLMAEPSGNSLTSLVVLMFGIPGEPMTVGKEIEWKPGGAFPAMPDQKSTVLLREVKGGRATIERSLTTKESQRVKIVSTHEIETGRMLKGEITGKGQGGADVKLSATLKGVKKG